LLPKNLAIETDWPTSRRSDPSSCARFDFGDLGVEDASEYSRPGSAKSKASRSEPLGGGYRRKRLSKSQSNGRFEENLRDIGKNGDSDKRTDHGIAIKVTIISANGLRRADWLPGEASTPYCICDIPGKPASSFRTRVRERTLNPIWRHEQVLLDYEAGDSLTFSVFDKDWGKEDDLLGTIDFESTQFLPEGLTGEFKLTQTGKDEPATIKLNVQVVARAGPVEVLRVWQGDGPDNCQTRGSIVGGASASRRSTSGRIFLPDGETSFADADRSRSAKCLRMLRNCRCDFAVLRPEASRRMVWDLCGIGAVMIDLVWIPMQVFDPVGSAGIQAVGWLTLLYWTMDMIMTLNTGYYAERGIQVFISRRLDIAKRYVRSGWFFFDITLVGIEWVGVVQMYSGSSSSAEASDSAGAARAGRVARVTRIVRLLRLMRLAKLRQLLFALQSLIDSEWLTIVFAVGKNMFMILSMNHFLAAAWFLVGKLSGRQGWVERQGYDSMDYGTQYLASLQWSLSQFTPGSSPLGPDAIGERVFAVSVLAMAMIIATCFVSSITSTMAAVWAVNRYKNQQAFLLKKFLCQMCVSRELGARVTRYIECVVELRHKTVPISKVEYLKLLSGPLNVELQGALYEPHLIRHPFFFGLVETSKNAIRQLCTSALQTDSYAKNDTLFERGAECKHMYFVTKGSLAYRYIHDDVSQTKQTLKLDEKQWCCEHPLWIHWAHRGAMKGLSDFEVITLNAAKFSDVTSKANRTVFLIAREQAVLFALQAQTLLSFGSASVLDIPSDRDLSVDRESNTDDLEVRRAMEFELKLIDFSDSEDEGFDDIPWTSETSVERVAR